MKRNLVLDSLAKAVYSSKPLSEVMARTYQGSQYGSSSWVRFCWNHGLTTSMSRRSNCHDNAVVESFNRTLKNAEIKRKIYKTREEAQLEIFDCIK